MAILNKILPGMFGGISKQIPELRLENQVEDALNVDLSIVEGISRRNPVVVDKVLSNVAYAADDFKGNNYYKIIDYPLLNEKYLMVIINEDPSTKPVIRIINLSTGTVATVTTTLAVKQYLKSGFNRENGLAMLQHGDSLLIASKDMEVQRREMSVLVADMLPRYETFEISGLGYYPVKLANTHLVTIKRALESVVYSITIEGNTVSHTATASDTTETIAEALRSALASLFTSTLTKYRVTTSTGNKNTFLFGYKPNSDVLSLTAPLASFSDSLGGGGMSVIRDNITSIEDLPNITRSSFGSDWEDFVPTVAVGNAESTGKYYLRLGGATGDPSGSEGTWIETTEPVKLLSSNTVSTNSITDIRMPVVIVRTGTNTFTATNIQPVDRKVGDDLTAPFPSFVGKTIKDLFLYKGRLGIITDDSIVFSKVNAPYDFFPDTALDVLDTDPIDITLIQGKSNLEYAIPYDGHIVLFSSTEQFLINKNSLLSPNTVNVGLITRYSCSPLVTPVVGTNSIYFKTNTVKETEIMEFFVRPEQEQYLAVSITSNIKGLIPEQKLNTTKMFLLFSGVSNQLLVVTTNTAESLSMSQVFSMRYYNSGDEGQRVQQAWSRIAIPGTNFYPFTEEDNLRFFNFVTVAERYHLSSLKLSKSTTADEDYAWFLDFLEEIDGEDLSYISAFDATDTGYSFYDSGLGIDVEYVAVTEDGTLLEVETDLVTTTVYLKGDQTGWDKIYVGVKYNSLVELSPLFLRNEQGIGITQGLLNIKSMELTLTNTEEIDINLEYNSHKGKFINHKYRGRQVLGLFATQGKKNIKGYAKHRVPVYAQNTNIRTLIGTSTPYRFSINTLSYQVEPMFKGIRTI